MSTPILNNTQVRDFIFETIRVQRPALVKKMTRVSEDFYDRLEMKLRIRIHADVQTASRGELKTLRVGSDSDADARDPALPWLVNQTQLHQFATDAMRGSGLTQVAGSYVHACDAFLRTIIHGRISSMPSVGKTVQ